MGILCAILRVILMIFERSGGGVVGVRRWFVIAESHRERLVASVDLGGVCYGGLHHFGHMALTPTEYFAHLLLIVSLAVEGGDTSIFGR